MDLSATRVTQKVHILQSAKAVKDLKSKTVKLCFFGTGQLFGKAITVADTIFRLWKLLVLPGLMGFLCFHTSYF